MLSKALLAAALAWPFKVPVSPVMLAAFERRFEILVNDLKGFRIGVVDADLLRRERVLDDLDLDALVRQRARDIEAERFQIARQHFHGGDAARLDGRDKIGAGWRTENPRRPKGRAAAHRRDCARPVAPVAET